MADRYEPGMGSGAGAGRAREPERSLADIARDALWNVQEIIRSEIRLARAEMQEKAAQARQAGILLAVGAVTGLYAVAFVLVCVYNALAYVMWPWLSALLIGIVLAAVAGMMLGAGVKRLKRLKPTPERTVESVKENVEWVRNQTRSSGT
jgi:apolipoprotein N-acyltransferase